MSLFLSTAPKQKGKRKRAVPVSLQAINIKTAVLGVILIHHVTSGFHSPSPVTPHSLKYRVRYSSHTNQHYPPQLCAGRTRTIVQVSTENRTVDVLTRAELQKLTVKELKERIKDLNSDVKISHLKLKKDLVDYLVAYNDETSEHEKVSSSLELNEPVSNPPNVDLLVPSSRSQRKKVLKMPPLTGKHEILAENNSQSSNSPKDVLFEQVFSRYPPLRQFNEDTEAKEKVILEGKDEVNAYEKYTHSSSLNPFTGLGDLDIRQQHHPMLANLKTSDLDIITVGTASCVPGVTRGVSCTALRLQWRRSANLKKNQGKDDGMVTGGIWVFDCGESTQVCFHDHLFFSKMRGIRVFAIDVLSETLIRKERWSVSIPLRRLIMMIHRCWHQTENISKDVQWRCSSFVTLNQFLFLLIALSFVFVGYDDTQMLAPDREYLKRYSMAMLIFCNSESVSILLLDRTPFCLCWL